MSIVGVNRKNRIYDSNKRQIIKLSLVFEIGEKTYVKYDYENACHRSNDIDAYKDE